MMAERHGKHPPHRLIIFAYCELLIARKSSETFLVYPSDIILIEGILVLYIRDLRTLMDMRLFVDTDSDIRLSRRVQRDIETRGRQLENVLGQYTQFVKPSFEEFCLPTKNTMILLEENNLVIFETLKAKFTAAKPESVAVVAIDFDGVKYNITNPGQDKGVITLSACMRIYSDLVAHGVVELLKREYGDYLVDPEEGYDVTLRYELASLPEDKESVAKKASLLKRNCFAAVFEKYFKMQEEESPSSEMATVHYHEEEAMYIAAQSDRVTIIFSTVFKDPDDVVIGKVFLQEFKDARKAHQQAPQVLFSYGEAPRELAGVKGVLSGDNVGFVTFVLFPRHTNPANRENTINLIHQFRTYLHYHIKCRGVRRATVHYHEEEAMYIAAQSDRVTIIFSTVFKDPDDVVIGKVFLQEFKDARKAHQQAPQVLFSYGEAPRELAGVKGVLSGDNVGFRRSPNVCQIRPDSGSGEDSSNIVDGLVEIGKKKREKAREVKEESKFEERLEHLIQSYLTEKSRTAPDIDGDELLQGFKSTFTAIGESNTNTQQELPMEIDSAEEDDVTFIPTPPTTTNTTPPKFAPFPNNPPPILANPYTRPQHPRYPPRLPTTTAPIRSRPPPAPPICYPISPAAPPAPPNRPRGPPPQHLFGEIRHQQQVRRPPFPTNQLPKQFRRHPPPGPPSLPPPPHILTVQQQQFNNTRPPPPPPPGSSWDVPPRAPYHPIEADLRHIPLPSSPVHVVPEGAGEAEMDIDDDGDETQSMITIPESEDTGSYAEDSIPSEDDLESISSSDDSGSNHTPSPPARSSNRTKSPPQSRDRGASNHTPSPPTTSRSKATNHATSPLRSKASNNSISLRDASNSRKTNPEPVLKATTDKTNRKPVKTTLLKTIMCSPPKLPQPLKPTTSNLQSASNLQITITNKLPNGATPDISGPAESHDGKEEGELDGSDSSDQLETGEVAALRSMLLNSIRKKKDNVPSPPPEPVIPPPVVEQPLEEHQLAAPVSPIRQSKRIKTSGTPFSVGETGSSKATFSIEEVAEIVGELPVVDEEAFKRFYVSRKQQKKARQRARSFKCDPLDLLKEELCFDPHERQWSTVSSYNTAAVTPGFSWKRLARYLKHAESMSSRFKQTFTEAQNGSLDQVLPSEENKEGEVVVVEKQVEPPVVEVKKPDGPRDRKISMGTEDLNDMRDILLQSMIKKDAVEKLKQLPVVKFSPSVSPVPSPPPPPPVEQPPVEQPAAAVAVKQVTKPQVVLKSGRGKPVNLKPKIIIKCPSLPSTSKVQPREDSSLPKQNSAPSSENSENEQHIIRITNNQPTPPAPVNQLRATLNSVRQTTPPTKPQVVFKKTRQSSPAPTMIAGLPVHESLMPRNLLSLTPEAIKAQREETRRIIKRLMVDKDLKVKDPVKSEISTEKRDEIVKRFEPKIRPVVIQLTGSDSEGEGEGEEGGDEKLPFTPVKGDDASRWSAERAKLALQIVKLEQRLVSYTLEKSTQNKELAGHLSKLKNLEVQVAKAKALVDKGNNLIQYLEEKRAGCLSELREKNRVVADLTKRIEEPDKWRDEQFAKASLDSGLGGGDEEKPGGSGLQITADEGDGDMEPGEIGSDENGEGRNTPVLPSVATRDSSEELQDAMNSVEDLLKSCLATLKLPSWPREKLSIKPIVEFTPRATERREKGKGDRVSALYTSPLTFFRSYRFSPYYRSKAQLALTSATYSHKIRPDIPLCPHDLHGKCLDRTCQRQHLSTVTSVSGAELRTQLCVSAGLKVSTISKFEQLHRNLQDSELNLLFCGHLNKMRKERKKDFYFVNTTHVPPVLHNIKRKDTLPTREKLSAYLETSSSQTHHYNKPEGGGPRVKKYAFLSTICPRFVQGYVQGYELLVSKTPHTLCATFARAGKGLLRYQGKLAFCEHTTYLSTPVSPVRQSKRIKTSGTPFSPGGSSKTTFSPGRGETGSSKATFSIEDVAEIVGDLPVVDEEAFKRFYVSRKQQKKARQRARSFKCDPLDLLKEELCFDPHERQWSTVSSYNTAAVTPGFSWKRLARYLKHAESMSSRFKQTFTETQNGSSDQVLSSVAEENTVGEVVVVEKQIEPQVKSGQKPDGPRDRKMSMGTEDLNDMRDILLQSMIKKDAAEKLKQLPVVKFSPSVSPVPSPPPPPVVEQPTVEQPAAAVAVKQVTKPQVVLKSGRGAIKPVNLKPKIVIKCPSLPSTSKVQPSEDSSLPKQPQISVPSSENSENDQNTIRITNNKPTPPAHVNQLRATLNSVRQTTPPTKPQVVFKKTRQSSPAPTMIAGLPVHESLMPRNLLSLTPEAIKAQREETRKIIKRLMVDKDLKVKDPVKSEISTEKRDEIVKRFEPKIRPVVIQLTGSDSEGEVEEDEGADEKLPFTPVKGDDCSRWSAERAKLALQIVKLEQRLVSYTLEKSTQNKELAGHLSKLKNLEVQVAKAKALVDKGNNLIQYLEEKRAGCLSELREKNRVVADLTKRIEEPDKWRDEQCAKVVLESCSGLGGGDEEKPGSSGLQITADEGEGDMEPGEIGSDENGEGRNTPVLPSLPTRDSSEELQDAMNSVEELLKSCLATLKLPSWPREKLSIKPIVEFTPRATERRDKGNGDRVSALYTSPLTFFRSYRFSPYYRSKAQLALTSATYSHKIRPDIPLCPHDLHGKCLDRTCQRQHLSTVTSVSGAELRTQLCVSAGLKVSTISKFEQLHRNLQDSELNLLFCGHLNKMRKERKKDFYFVNTTHVPPVLHNIKRKDTLPTRDKLSAYLETSSSQTHHYNNKAGAILIPSKRHFSVYFRFLKSRLLSTSTSRSSLNILSWMFGYFSNIINRVQYNQKLFFTEYTNLLMAQFFPLPERILVVPISFCPRMALLGRVIGRYHASVSEVTLSQQCKASPRDPESWLALVSCQRNRAAGPSVLNNTLSKALQYNKSCPELWVEYLKLKSELSTSPNDLIAHYEQALKLAPSPVLWKNLAPKLGSFASQIEALDSALRICTDTDSECYGELKKDRLLLLHRAGYCVASELEETLSDMGKLTDHHLLWFIRQSLYHAQTSSLSYNPEDVTVTSPPATLEGCLKEAVTIVTDTDILLSLYRLQSEVVSVLSTREAAIALLSDVTSRRPELFQLMEDIVRLGGWVEPDVPWPRLVYLQMESALENGQRDLAVSVAGNLVGALIGRQVQDGADNIVQLYREVLSISMGGVVLPEYRSLTELDHRPWLVMVYSRLSSLFPCDPVEQYRLYSTRLAHVVAGSEEINSLRHAISYVFDKYLKFPSLRYFTVMEEECKKDKQLVNMTSHYKHPEDRLQEMADFLMSYRQNRSLLIRYASKVSQSNVDSVIHCMKNCLKDAPDDEELWIMYTCWFVCLSVCLSL
eukprot:sb/3460344/